MTIKATLHNGDRKRDVRFNISKFQQLQVFLTIFMGFFIPSVIWYGKDQVNKNEIQNQIKTLSIADYNIVKHDSIMWGKQKLLNNGFVLVMQENKLDIEKINQLVRAMEWNLN